MHTSWPILKTAVTDAMGSEGNSVMHNMAITYARGLVTSHRTEERRKVIQKYLMQAPCFLIISY